MIPETRKPEDYSDIIDYEYHGTTTHIPMPMEKRAAQFSPFAALTGMGDKFNEEMRYMDDKVELTEEKVEEINRSLQGISEVLARGKTADVIMTRFIPDLTKDGGMYKTDSASIKKMDSMNHVIVLTNGTEVPIADITNITPVRKTE